jgi:hypothetical protein
MPIGFCVLGMYFYHGNEAFLATAQPAEGTIIALAQLKDNDDSSDHGGPVPVVRFGTDRGEEAQSRENTYILWKDYAQGQSVRILYPKIRKTPGLIRFGKSGSG